MRSLDISSTHQARQVRRHAGDLAKSWRKKTEVGGYGSGRWGCHSARSTVQECRTLDVRRFVSQGVFGGDAKRGEIHWTDSEGRDVAAVEFTYEPDGMSPVLRLLFVAR